MISSSSDPKSKSRNKEAHGLPSVGLYRHMQYSEGPVQPGMKVVIVDDVVTTGGSSLLAIDRIQEFGCEVVQVVAIVDRMEGGAANFAARGLTLNSLLTIEDFGITPPAA